MAGPLETSWGATLPFTVPGTLPSEYEGLPGYIFGYVQMMVGRTSVRWITARNPDLARTAPYRVGDGVRDAARALVEDRGLTVIAESRLGLAVAGSADAWDRLHGGVTRAGDVAALKAPYGRIGSRRYMDVVAGPHGPEQPAEIGVGAVPAGTPEVGDVTFERPRTTLTPPAAAASGRKPFYLEVPGDVAVLTGAAKAHARPERYRGSGVHVAMVDTGHADHPFFEGLAVEPTVVLVEGTGADSDPVGHGTAESANVFAVAPEATLHPYRVSDGAGNIVATLAGFMKAKADAKADPRRGPDGKPPRYVITCSWGADSLGPLPAQPRGHERAMVMEIVDAIEQGIVVVFAAGNGGHSIEAQVPGVISAGGAYIDEQMRLLASNYASAYRSVWQPSITVPKVCGLVGMQPDGAYLRLPIPRGCTIESDEAKVTREPPIDKGWALLSGTSAAAPQVAGAAAVLLGARPDLTPRQLAECLRKSAIDVRAGSCHPYMADVAGAADGRADIPTGHGLIDVDEALTLALALPA